MHAHTCTQLLPIVLVMSHKHTILLTRTSTHGSYWANSPSCLREGLTPSFLFLREESLPASSPTQEVVEDPPPHFRLSWPSLFGSLPNVQFFPASSRLQPWVPSLVEGGGKMESLSSALLHTKYSINLQLGTRSVLCPSQSPSMTERLKPLIQSPSP